MKDVVVQKVQDLRAPARRVLEGLLGRTLEADEEVLLIARPGAAPPGNGEESSCYDLAARLGLIGMVKNAPPDLSTNRQHMEGFGG